MFNERDRKVESVGTKVDVGNNGFGVSEQN